MKRMIGIRVLTAVLVLTGVAAAFASGCAQQEKHEMTEAETRQPSSISQPEESAEPLSKPTLQSDGSGEAQDTLLQSIFDGADDDEYVFVENGMGSAFDRGSFRTFDTADELKGALEEDGSPLRLFDAPDRYELISARIWYDCAAGYEYTLTSTETTDTGLTVKKYAIPEEGRFISSYNLEYAAPDGKSFLIAGYLTRDMETNAMEDETVESVAVDGMDDALLFCKEDGEAARLEMRQSLAEPIAYVSSMSLAEIPPGLEGTPFFEEMKNVPILYVCYSISADDMDGDMLLALVKAS